MPSYEFTNPFSQVFGDLHHGVNATVSGLEHVADEIYGAAVELHLGDIVSTVEPVVHEFLHEVDAAAVPAQIVPQNVAPAEPDSPAETQTETVAPEGAEQNTEVQS